MGGAVTDYVCMKTPQNKKALFQICFHYYYY